MSVLILVFFVGNFPTKRTLAILSLAVKLDTNKCAVGYFFLFDMLAIANDLFYTISAFGAFVNMHFPTQRTLTILSLAVKLDRNKCAVGFIFVVCTVEFLLFA